jgi:hypothetical protein
MSSASASNVAMTKDLLQLNLIASFWTRSLMTSTTQDGSDSRTCPGIGFCVLLLRFAIICLLVDVNSNLSAHVEGLFQFDKPFEHELLPLHIRHDVSSVELKTKELLTLWIDLAQFLVLLP